jgi:hypothetical protein
MGVTRAAEDARLRVSFRHPGDKFAPDTGLTNAGFAANGRSPPYPLRQRRRKRRLQFGKLRLSPDHRRVQPGQPAYAAPFRLLAHHQVHSNWFRLALHRDLLRRLKIKNSPNTPRCRRADHNPAHRRGVFQPRGQVDRVAHHRVAARFQSAHQPSQHFARVQADAHPQAKATLLLQIGAEVGDDALHRQGGAHGHLFVVFQRLWRAEQSHHGVAAVFVNRAAKAVDFRRHRFKQPVHNRGYVLWVQIFTEGRVARHVGKQHSDALAFVGRLLRLDKGCQPFTQQPQGGIYHQIAQGSALRL